MKFKPLTIGDRYGRLVVVSNGEAVRRGNGKRSATSVCLCDCGHETTIQNIYLRSGDTKSCGCLVPEISAVNMSKHGGCGTPEYRIWCAMITRCTNPRQSHYHRYGGRGISICDRWRNSYAAFLQDMGPRPSQNHSIDRIDNDGNYEPENCRWATTKEQFRNVAKNLHFTFYGTTRPIRDWSAISSVKENTIIMRLRLGWSERAAVWTPTMNRGKRR